MAASPVEKHASEAGYTQQQRHRKDDAQASLKARFEALCREHLRAVVEARGAAIKDLGHFYMRFEAGGFGERARVTIIPVGARASELIFTLEASGDVVALTNFYPKALGSRRDVANIQDLSYEYFDQRVRTLFRVALGGVSRAFMP